MNLKQFARERFSTGALNRLQDRVQDWATQLDKQEIVNGVLLKDVALTTSQTSIAHKLGRVPTGVILVRTPVQLDIWEPTAADKDFLYIQASAATTVNLWVF